jgi:tRNA pseudouridine55 synthase
MSPLPDVFAVYKDEGMTSHDVVDVVRRLTGEKRVGHAGTLDPCARGVLVIGVGRAATKRLGSVAGTEKEYVTRVKLGWRSTTDDREGRKEQVVRTTEDRGQTTEGTAARSLDETPSKEQVRQALARFQGVIAQRPPAFSAIKVRGRAAYKLARAARLVELPARRVEVKEIEFIGYAWPQVDVRLVTGPGFYVRSFARDLGEILGTGAYMEELERTRVGPYTKEQAIRLTDLPARLADRASAGE